MNSKRLFQIFVLLTLLFAPLGANQPVHASPSAVDILDSPNSGHDFPGLQNEPTVSVLVSPGSVNVGEMTTVTVKLNHVPAEGYTSTELTCTYDPDFVEASNIVIGNLFGIDPVTAINDPHNGQFIVAIAGSNGKRTVSSGVLLAFNVRGLQAGQSSLGCQARVSTGNNALTTISSTGTKVTVLENILTPTVGPALCDKVQFMADVTVPDGTNFPPGATFTKTWRLKNVGSCTWTTSYQLVFFSGEQMGAPSSVSFSRAVAPGQVVDISVSLTAPSSPGSYRGYWMFKNANGALFGIGAQANRAWWLEIRVSAATVTPTVSQTQSSSILGLTKSSSSQTYSGPAQTITYTFTITNMGTAPLGPAQFTITDNKLGAPFNCGPANVILAPNQSLACSMSYMTTSADMALANITNSATASGAGQTSAPATAVVTNLVAPATLTPSITPGGPTATPIPNIVYDFAANVCAATWFSGAGQLQCPGIEGDVKGFVLKINNPKLETGATDTRPGILTVPQNVQNGYIQGFYPRFHVQSGDRFRSTIGCEGGATNCYLAFRLDYQVGSDSIKTFWGPFLERYDGRIYSVDVDLSPLAGQDVRFILTLLSAGVATGDRALWVGPIISRSNASSTPTSDVLQTPSTPPTSMFTPTSTEPPISTFTSTPTESPVPTSTPSGVGLLTGQVFASKLVTINVYDSEDNLVGAGWVNPDGTFDLNASIGTNTVIVSASGFLSAQRSVTITEGSRITLPTITLMAGDIDGDNVIDQFDAITIGMSYNTSTPSAADLNDDGIINVLDLELLAKNYRKTGPVTW
jgi:uncharacterized repeat protein (TIGR01451 family)